MPNVLAQWSMQTLTFSVTLQTFLFKWLIFLIFNFLLLAAGIANGTGSLSFLPQTNLEKLCNASLGQMFSVTFSAPNKDQLSEQKAHIVFITVTHMTSHILTIGTTKFPLFSSFLVLWEDFIRFCSSDLR